jgi:hypothetical protein
MFVVRRIFKVKKGTARKAAKVITGIGNAYEALGQRKHSWVYISGSTVPGPADTVYMEWAEEALMSAYRAEVSPAPPELDKLFKQLAEYQEETWVEFYEMYSEA